MRNPPIAVVFRVHRKFVWAGALLLVFAIVAFLVATRKPSADGSQTQAVLEFSQAEITYVSPATLSQILPITGSLEPVNRVTLRAKAGADLREVTVREGDHVTAGQLIARIDTTDLEAKLVQQQGGLYAARANAAQSARALQTNRELLDKGFISKNAYDAAESAHQANDGQAQTAAAGVALAKHAVVDARLIAPFSGIVAKRFVQAGDKVSLDAPIVTIVDLRKLELQAMVPAVEVSRVNGGAKATLHVEGFDETSIEGRVERIAPSTEPGTRAVSVVVSVDNSQERLKTGMFASGEIEVARTLKVDSLPAESLRTANGSTFVWTIVQGKLARRSVQVGRRDDVAGRVEIVSGLTAELPVLAARFDNLQEGAPATIKTPADRK